MSGSQGETKVRLANEASNVEIQAIFLLVFRLKIRHGYRVASAWLKQVLIFMFNVSQCSCNNNVLPLNCNS